MRKVGREDSVHGHQRPVEYFQASDPCALFHLNGDEKLQKQSPQHICVLDPL